MNFWFNGLISLNVLSLRSKVTKFNIFLLYFSLFCYFICRLHYVYHILFLRFSLNHHLTRLYDDVELIFESSDPVINPPYMKFVMFSHKS